MPGISNGYGMIILETTKRWGQLGSVLWNSIHLGTSDNRSNMKVNNLKKTAMETDNKCSMFIEIRKRTFIYNINHSSM